MSRDGLRLPLVVYYDPWPAMRAFDTLEVGFVLHHASPPVEVWLDEIAVDTQPIGCER